MLAIEKGHFAKKVTAAKRRQMVRRASVERQMAEEEVAAPLAQDVLDVLEHVRGSDIHGLDAAHVEDEIHTRLVLQLGLERGVELVGGAKEKTPLQLEDHGAVAAALEH